MILRIISLLFLDQLLKQYFFQFGAEHWIIESRLGFHLQMNRGAAFSIPIPSVVTIVLGFAVLLFLGYAYEHYLLRSRVSLWIFALLFAGTAGNLIDRLFLGSVVDFVQVFWWPTFNLADSFLVVGMVLLFSFWDEVVVRK